ncbi:hypothetical protein COU19_02575 [Candidatus Kaiserbacteria bacterium CG10_big_fil_rev_8_21_14_0_10_56_12]|uniref:Uncharacterized protein n=1 Tax=Candidatus Kaiserbacteria bacterium CG10_big_fil_rev_8_21_14_0_10_56_12 TaxID=1974611 RepID=A0A2H0UBF9_9BACT|nr:MAG: hypothetical protein COU19_02575 [Candidatus Kaiserbacteria bacterium CG10_big_fil_rev_8_21_14_0_10_56_12]
MTVGLVLCTSSSLLVPQPARASGLPVFDAAAFTNTSWSALKNTLTAVSTVSSAASNIAMKINQYVLEPLAFVTSGNLIRSITAGVVSFITDGTANGTGKPLFVQDLPGNLQGVGDTQANAFLIQFGKNSHSPFSRAIAASLRANYYQQTSLAGFFAEYRDTLPQYSQNPQAFLRGDWSQGGIGAWMALTTQPENNPYLLHERAQAELALMVYDQTSARLNELAWGGGYLSWCGGTAANNACKTSDGVAGMLAGDGSCTSNASSAPGATVSSVAGDSCIKADGTMGSVQTPGSTIKASLDKVLGLASDKVVAMGNASSQINSILGDIAKVMNTVNFASQILGSASVSGATGGLAGSSQPRPSGTSFLNDYQNTPGAFGVTETGVLADAAANPSTNGQQLLDTAKEYETAWGTTRTMAETTAGTLNELIQRLGTRSCKDKGYYLDAAVVQGVLSDVVAPVLAHADAADTAIANARSFVQTLQTEAVATGADAHTQYLRDLQTLQNMSPTTAELAQIQQETLLTDRAVVDPEGSFALSVSDGTLADRLTLITANAKKLESRCYLPATSF